MRMIIFYINNRFTDKWDNINRSGYTFDTAKFVSCYVDIVY